MTETHVSAAPVSRARQNKLMRLRARQHALTRLTHEHPARFLVLLDEEMARQRQLAEEAAPCPAT